MEHTISTSDFKKSVKETLGRKTDIQLIDCFNRECGSRGWTQTRSIYLHELQNEMKKRAWDISAITNESGGFNLADGNQVFLMEGKLFHFSQKS